MYDIKRIRENPEAFDRGLTRRGLEPLSGTLLALDEKRRAAILAAEQAQARRNAASKEIGQAKAKKDEAAAAALMAEVATLKETLPTLEAEAKQYGGALDKELAQIPNAPADDVPEGADEHGNVEKSVHGAKRSYAFTPKQHFELGEDLKQMDFEAAAKLSGARFVVLQKGLARMERALGQFFLDTHVDEHGYTEVNPPLIVRPEVMFGTAQLPKFEDDQFYGLSVNPVKKMLEQSASMQTELNKFSSAFDPNVQSNQEILVLLKEIDADILLRRWPLIQKFVEQTAETVKGLGSDLKAIIAAIAAEYKEFASDQRWLIPTAEVPLTNLVRESIVAEDELPMRLTACTPCFRAEAGAAGRDTRGMIRQHQFTKVELVSITAPEKSREEHERMLACAEAVLKKLDLHYRVVTLCTGDMGFAAQKTYDIEVWLPGQNMYREISSCSVCGDFQAQRMKARYKGADGKVKGFVHTLNGSGVAVGRALVAVMETYQQDGGAIAVPDVLQPYMGGMKKIEKAA